MNIIFYLSFCKSGKVKRLQNEDLPYLFDLSIVKTGKMWYNIKKVDKEAFYGSESCYQCFK